MRKRAVILLAILIAIFGGSVNAQSFLGKLVDDKEAPVGFANVVLLNPEDSAFVKGTVSEESRVGRLERAVLYLAGILYRI